MVKCTLDWSKNHLIIFIRGGACLLYTSLCADRHICRNCGYESDTTLNNIKGICSDCGAVIADPEATLCPDCKHSREQKAKEWLAKAGKVVGVVTAVAGAAAYLASQISSDDSAEDDTGGISPKKDRCV